MIDTLNQTTRPDSDKSQDTRFRFSILPAMDTLPLEPVELVAIDPARNIRRHWSVVTSIDLFGHVLVERRWGRIGTHGRHVVHSFADPDRALRHIRTLLARRASAPQRLGVSYCLLMR